MWFEYDYENWNENKDFMQGLYGVLDKKVGSYVSFFVERHFGKAKRDFMDALVDSKCPYSKHPLDYDLYLLCGVQDLDGDIVVCKSMPELVISGKEAERLNQSEMEIRLRKQIVMEDLINSLKEDVENEKKKRVSQKEVVDDQE